MKRNRIEPSFLALLTAIAALLFLNYRLVLYAQYETDEFLHSAWGGDLHVGIPAYAPEMPGKTRLSLVLFSLPFKMTNRMADILLINRHAVFFVVIASLYVLFLLHGNVFGSRRGALWAVFWTLACTTFIERGFRVRSDMVATAFALVGVHQFLVGRPSVRAWAAGAWMSLAFCTTQKSAYFILSFIVAFWVAYRLAGENALREFSRFALGGLAVFAGYVLAFGRGGNYATVLKTTFFSDLVMDTALGRNYGALAPYYWQTFARNIAFYCLAFAGLGYILRGWRSNPWPQNFLAVFTAVLLGCMTIHREPWPYVFVMVIPFLGCFAGWISEAVLQALRTTDRMVAVPALVLLFTVGVESIVRHVAHFQITCFPQLETVATAEAVLEEKDTYFDGIRMIGTRRWASPEILYRAFLDKLIAAWDTDGRALLQRLRDAQCKVIIYNFRIAALPPGFQQFLGDHYVLLDRNVFVSGCEANASPRDVDLVWAGEYEAIAGETVTRVRIDDQDVLPGRRTVHLSSGKHRVVLEGEGSVLLVPRVAAQWMREHPVLRDVYPLFGPP